MAVVVTKPCGRAGRGCRALIRATSQASLDARVYCSTRCAGLARAESGALSPATLTDDARRAGGRLGGRRSAEARRSLAVRRAVEATEALIPRGVLARLDDHARGLLSIALARAYRRGLRAGMNRQWHRARRRAAQGGSSCSVC